MKGSRAFKLSALAAAAVLFAALLCVSLPFSDAARGAGVYSDYDDTYVFNIESEEDYAAFSALYNNTEHSFNGRTIRLYADVDASKSPLHIPFFRGAFEGNGHAVYNLTSPLFGTIAEFGASAGTVKDLDLIGINVSGSALASINQGVVENVSAFGVLTPSSSDFQASLVKTNTGTITGCFNACDYSGGANLNRNLFAGIAYDNKGTISDSVFAGRFGLVCDVGKAYSAAGIALVNTGAVVSCVSAADFAVTEYSANGLLPSLYAVSGGGASAPRGTISESAAYVNFDKYTEAEDAAPAFCGGEEVTNSFIVYSDGRAGYAFDGAIAGCTTAELTEDKLGASFIYGGRYPLPLSLFSGKGSEHEPFLISSRADAAKLRISGISADFSYEMTADLNMHGMETLAAGRGFAYLGGEVDGAGFAFKYAQGERIYAEEYALRGKNVGFVGCAAATLSGNPDDGYTDGGYSFGHVPGETTLTIPSAPTGGGTPADPYIVTNASELKWLDGREGYAVLASDIMLNAEGRSGNRLGIEELKVDLNGNGHTVAGLTGEPLCARSVGRVFNLTVRGYGSDALFAAENAGEISRSVGAGGALNSGFAANNSGVIRDCAFYGDFTSAAFGTNSGSVAGCVNYGLSAEGTAFAAADGGRTERCENRGAVGYAFSAEGTGSVADCVNYTDSEFSPSDTGITSSIDFDVSGGAVYDEGTRYEASGFSYSELRRYASFDFSEVFGYPSGSDVPELRRPYAEYKSFHPRAFTDYELLSDRYSENISYELSLVEYATVATKLFGETTFVWTFEGGSMTGDFIKNAGTYVLKAEFAGNDYYLAEDYEHSFVISKASAPVAVEFGQGDFDDVTTAYDGEYHIPARPAPSNMASLAGYGYAAEWSLTEDGRGLTSYRSAGSYVQTVTLVSPNYESVSARRNVTVAKAELFVKVGDLNCGYLSGAGLERAAASITGGLKESDEGKTLESLVTDYRNGFYTDYSASMDAGLYSIGFNGVADNYELTVTAGVLTVVTIPLPADGIEFYGADANTVGSVTRTYDGSAIYLEAVYPDGVSAEYRNNGHTGASEEGYQVTVVLTKKNYDPLELTARLIINKAPLTVAAPDKEEFYGAIASLDGLNVEIKGFVGNDDFAVLAGTVFSLSLYDGDAPAATGAALDAKAYAIRPSAEGISDNYSFVFEDGVYLVKKASLKALYDNNASSDDSFADLNGVYSGSAFVRKITFFREEEAEIEYSVFRNGVSVDTITDAGSYEVMATVTPIGALRGNYEITEYECAVVVNKRPTSVAFGKESYEFVYEARDYAVISNFSYTGDLPRGEEPALACFRDGALSNAVHAGRYRLTLTAEENDNEYGCTATAELTVKPAPLTVVYRTEYDYTGSPVFPEPILIDGAFGGEVTAGDLVCTLKNSSGTIVTNAVNAGSYTFTLAVNNADYDPVDKDFGFAVKKLELEVVWGTLKYPYGTAGDYTAEDGTVYSVGETRVTRRNYTVDGLKFDITVGLPSGEAGRYELNDASLSEATNYRFVFAGGTDNVIEIEKRGLIINWTLDGADLYADRYTTEYKGYSQSYRFGYVAGNLASGDSAADLTLTSRTTGQGEDIFDAGSYVITVSLTDNVNYYLKTPAFYVTVTKAPLYITVNDATVARGESYNYPSFTVSGTVGGDVGKTADRLKDASINIVTDYTPTAPVNATFSVGIRSSFANYEPEVLRVGVLTVVANPYPDYVLTDVSFVYDGTYHTVVIPGVAPEVTVSYSNNSHRDVGVHTVSAVITYPSGRQRTTSCRLSIIKAAPVVTVPPHETVYSENTLLTDDFIKGSALLNGVAVTGTFAFTSEQYLKEGTHEYEYRFTPTDGNNLERVVGVFEIRSERIDIAAFQFSPASAIQFTLEGAEITEPVTMTLSPVLNGLELYRDGYRVDFVVFGKDETVSVEVRFGLRTVFSHSFVIKLVTPPGPIVIDDDSFALTGMSISGKTLLVGDKGGRIALAEKYKSSYNLYVNGYATEEFTVNGDEGELTVIVRSKATGKTVFTKVYTVEREELNGGQPKDYRLYYILGGCALGAAVLIGLFVFLWRKKHG